MFDDSRAFVSRAFLRSELDLEFRAWDGDEALQARLKAWADRAERTETSAEVALIQTFFAETWGYADEGRVARADVTLYPKFRVPDAGAGGHTGEADAALGFFGMPGPQVAQVLCEFKDIRSALDARQARKNNTRSPVQQCQDYIRGARKGMLGNESVQPWWGLVTDMNEFRLYWWDRMPQQYLRFVIRAPNDLFAGGYDLLATGEDAKFDRFLFERLFHRDTLLSSGGKPPLLRLIERQWLRERKLEGEFYERYRAVRERLFNVLRVNNRDFAGTPTDLLRLSQKLLDRFIFAFYCEDMGQRMAFPPQFIRDRLRDRSKEPDFDPDGDELWGFFRRLFGFMDTGGQLGTITVPHINGGLFAHDPQVESLRLPNHVFVARGQGGQGEGNLELDRDTLFYLCARYNYASQGEARESLSLYTLGRIFEQSITELEYREGELENRASVAALSERKRNGVYYTPEWAVNLLVKAAMDPWFEAARREAGLPDDNTEVTPSLEALEAYERKLTRLRVIDPACGSGAFLISAFRRLLDERVTLARQIADLRAWPDKIPVAVDEPALIGEILDRNIYGVDLNPASVEIAKLALWLHSARANAPLSSLDHTLRCGNSLVGPDFWHGRADDAGLRERVNAFDWTAAFPEARLGQQGGGFDIVLGNPPYVKRQHLEVAAPQVAEYLMGARGDDTYRSATTGNFDLYLPFIEKGLRLLAPGGRMAFIAPNIWPIAQYGQALRGLVHAGRHLERWTDFRSHQVFADVTVYTALQVFSREPTPNVRIALAPEGEPQAAAVDWSDLALAVPWSGLAPDAEWLIVTGKDRALIERLAGGCHRLDDPALTTHIFQGLITSADDLYHLRRNGRNRYWCMPKNRAGASPHEVQIEDAIMRPLVSGPEAKRYEEPQTDTWLLFPYERDPSGRMRLMPRETLSSTYPLAWAHLSRWEQELRDRENKAFDDDQWWRFGRHQNIDKQDRTKLIVAQTVPAMRVSADTLGDKYLNNVRVNGILAANAPDEGFLLGALNGAVADFVFRRIGRPKAGGYYEANRQFIAPLPIPRADAGDRQAVARRAIDLQTAHTRRRDLRSACEDRLGVLARAGRDERWLWPDLPDSTLLKAEAPRAFTRASDRRAWADSRFDEAVAARLEALQAELARAEPLDARFSDGELRLLAGGAAVLGRIYLNDDEGRLVEAYWRWLCLSRSWDDAEALSRQLRRPPSDARVAAASQFIAKVVEYAEESAAVARLEDEMNEHLVRLYGLTPQERVLVENDARSRRSS